MIFKLLKAGDVDLVAEVMAAMGLDQEKAVKTINIIQSSGSLPSSKVSVGKKEVVIGVGQAMFEVSCPCWVVGISNTSVVPTR